MAYTDLGLFHIKYVLYDLNTIFTLAAILNSKKSKIRLTY